MQLAHLNEIAAVTDTTSSAERDEALRSLYREELDIGKISATEDQSLVNVYGDEDSFVDK